MKNDSNRIVLSPSGYLQHPAQSSVWNPYVGDNRPWKTWEEFLGTEPDKQSIQFNVYDSIQNGEFAVRVFDAKQCAYCKKPVLREPGFSRSWKSRRGAFIDDARCESSARVFNCTNCGWWYLDHEESESGFNEHIEFSHIYEGVIYQFDWAETSPAIAEVRQQVARRDLSLTDVSPKQLERLVGSIFRDYFGCQVKHIGGPGDEGVDLLLAYGGRVKAVVQVKRRKNSSAIESPAVIRELVGTMVHQDVNLGLLATTAAGISEKTSAWARNLPERYSHLAIDVYNQERLLEALDLATPSCPWSALLDELVERVNHKMHDRTPAL